MGHVTCCAYNQLTLAFLTGSCYICACANAALLNYLLTRGLKRVTRQRRARQNRLDKTAQTKARNDKTAQDNSAQDKSASIVDMFKGKKETSNDSHSSNLVVYTGKLMQITRHITRHFLWNKLLFPEQFTTEAQQTSLGRGWWCMVELG